MLDIPKKVDDFEVFPSNNASLSKKYTIRITDKYYDITETLYQLLELIDNKRTLTEISNLFFKTTGKTVSKSDLANIIDKHLVRKNIVFYDKTLKHRIENESYLLIKLPFLNNKIIKPVAMILKIFYQKYIIFVLLSGIILFHVYFYFIFDKASSLSFNALKFTEILLIYIILFFTTLFHEFGHAAACSYIGANFGSIGIGLYFNMPVFYADVTDIWLFKRYKRLLVDFGGIYFQLILVPVIFFIYLQTNNNIFLFVIYILNFSIISSLNPILRFDGYWIATDISGVPNLRKRSKELFFYYIKI